MLDGIEPDYLSIPMAVEIDEVVPVFPFRRGVVAPQGVAAEAHLCRAFDGIARNATRVVVIGQDPYPSIASATGRAFEDGSWDGTLPNLKDSLKRFTQSAILTIEDGPELPNDRADWGAVRQLVDNGQVTMPPNLRRYFDSMAQQGVLFINSSWTRSRDEDLKYHLELWKPVHDQLIKNLAFSADAHTVFLLFGESAQMRFLAADPIFRHAAIVAHPHPSRASHYFRTINPLERVNSALTALGQAPINWWPVDDFQVEPAENP